MKTLALIALALIAAPVAAQSTSVKGHIKKDGTYVPPHVRSKPNNTTLDNYSSKPNVNPYSGRRGTVDPYKPKPRAPRRF